MLDNAFGANFTVEIHRFAQDGSFSVGQLHCGIMPYG
jgi:hypothetical protein